MNQTNTILALIRKLFNAGNDEFIPLHIPCLNGNEKKYLNECIDSTFVSSVGKFVNSFEDKVAEYTKAKHAIVCVNGTNALHLALLLVGVESEDEVITQPLTFIATTNAITYANATPVFVDVDRDTMGMSPVALKKFLLENAELRDGVCYNKITNNRIKACMPMHTFGHACRIEEILSICNEYNIELVEDAAEGMGSVYKGKHLGTFGKVSAISFNGNKIMTTGGGGIILTDDDALAAKAKHLSTQSKIPHKWEYVHDNIGYNYRMPNINAALGLAQLERLDFFLENKRQLAKEYSVFFKENSIEFFDERDEEKCNFWLNAIIFNDKKERDSFLEESNDAGVMTRPIWQLMNKLPMFKNNIKGDLANSEWLEDRVVNIPSSVREK
ncbi:LegC family aminotransferase [Tenacibaculum jejuense]|uniref:GDP-perosamine synthase n=1 Tax=Tenacibaculum jejuense TaxID=584609 RepID=A0A238U6R5_9FLAO|nr:LegC family aminotransferase [Tenacibaculum jejuense]SNR14891.1 LLPSF_NHT_00031 family aminotransferase [Tenacibaculum jejuense]